MTTLPSSVPVLVVGAGVHGLSTAWHLAQKGERVLVVDKAGVAAGASGIACGVVRNNYFQPAMSELMAACVEIWESDPEAFHYHGSGYIALGPAAQEPDLVEVHERHRRIGYDSELITGEAAVAAHMRALYPDWRAEGLTVCLHEHRGGFAFNKESMLGLADKARAAGARDRRGRRGHGLRARRLRRRDRRPHERRRRRRRAGRDRRRAVGAAAVVDARAARPARRPPARRRGRRATSRCGPTGTCRRARRSSTRRSSSPPTARPRPCCTSTPTRRCAPTTAR